MNKVERYKYNKIMWKALSEVNDIYDYDKIKEIKIDIIEKLNLPITNQPYCYLCDEYSSNCSDCPLYTKQCSKYYNINLAYYKCSDAIENGNFSEFKKYAEELYNAIPEIDE